MAKDKSKKTIKINKIRTQIYQRLFAVILVLLLLLLLQDPQVRSFTEEVLGVQDDWISWDDQISNSPLEAAVVTRVIDGDTIELTDGTKVRYLNIDTPETVKPNTPVECYGLEAKTLNQELVKDQQVWLLTDKELTDIYNRELRFVFTTKEDTKDVTKSVNAIMVREGYAIAKFYSPNTTYKPQFEKLEAEAKRLNKGLWGEC
jgi:micrococcal nuclease